MSDNHPIPAATVVALKLINDQLNVLMLRRNPKLSAYGGAWVFPGGKVDESVDLYDGIHELESAKRAAVREAMEEAGLHVEMNRMVPFAHWTTPAIRPKRFSTWFFAIHIKGEDQTVEVDGEEIVEGRWFSPQEILQLHNQGDLNMVPPTYITLLEFSKFKEPESLIEQLKSEEVFHFKPKVVSLEDQVCYLYGGDAGYDAEDPSVTEVRHRLVTKGRDWQYFREI